jgi:hypothetical protein
MATKNRIGLQFSGFQEMAARLDELQGDLQRTTEEALIKSKEVVTAKLLEATNKANYPAQGKYSTGRTRQSIDTTQNVTWQGTTAEINVGFDLKKSGLTSIYLMYGTPRMAKVQAIYDAVYGSRVKAEIKRVQKETFDAAIKEKMEG